MGSLSRWQRKQDPGHHGYLRACVLVSGLGLDRAIRVTSVRMRGKTYPPFRLATPVGEIDVDAVPSCSTRSNGHGGIAFAWL